MDPSGSKKRFRFRFRLRTLLIVITCLAVLLGIPMHRINEGRRQGQIAERLARLGCSVEFWPRKRWVHPYIRLMGPQPGTLPRWLDETSLADAFYRFQRVSINSHPERDLHRVVDEIVKVHSIPALFVRRRDFNARHLERLMSSVRVHSLYLAETSIGRGSLPCLDQNGLTWLCVAHTQFSDPAIANLPTSLKYLNATRTRISDRGLHRFVRLRNLKELNLRRTPTTAEAIEDLRKQMPWCWIEWERLVHP